MVLTPPRPPSESEIVLQFRATNPIGSGVRNKGGWEFPITQWEQKHWKVPETEPRDLDNAGESVIILLEVN